MRNRFTLFLMLMFLMGTGMNAQTVVAKMKALADAAGNSDTKATVSTVWQSDDAAGAVYEFSNGKYLGAISNTDVVNALEGDKYVTIAMWVYGRTTPTGFQCVFGYGNVNDGVKFQQNGKSISATTKGVINIGGWDRDELLDDEWNLIAFAVAGKANTTVTTGKYYINDINANQDGLKLSGMNTPAAENKLLAIGSGDQNIARETYNGMIANLTVITSDDLLTNNKIKELVGTVSRIDGKRRVTINYTCASGTFSKKTYFAPNEVNTVPTPDFYTNVDPATITDDNSSASYNVNCDENFPFTAGTFCKLKLREKADNNRCVVWDGTSANINTRKSEAEATNAGMGSYWRFERVPNTENQVRLFTNCKGKSQAVTFTNMATDGQAATLTDNGTIFMVKTGNSDYTDPKGFRLSSLTNDNYNIYDVNGTLGVWTDDRSKTDVGSTFTVYAIDAQPTEVTSATCTDENGITATYSIASKGYYWNGTVSNAVSAPVLPGYMAATTASITAQGALSFNYTNNYPFVVSTDNAKYFQSLRVRNDATHYVTATYNSGSFAAGTTKSSNNGIATDETKQGIMKSGWAFVKEPGTINKFRIYNEATGNLQLYLPNERDKTAATMAASGTAFVVELQPTEFTAFRGGFTIRVNENDSHALGDHGDGTLAYWCNRGSSELNNDGSIFRVADADVWVKQVYTDFVTNSDAWVASLVNQSAASLPAYTAAKEAAATVISNNNSTNAQKMQAYRKVAQSLYTAKTNLLAEADAAQIYKLRSLTNSGDLYLNVKNNDLQGVIITQPIKYLKNQMFQLVKNETSGKYAIKCIADNSMLLNSSTGNNSWDIKSTTDSETHSEYTLGNVYNGNYTISKAAGKYLSPYGTCQTDGTYIIHSNITTANAWAFEPVSATDATKGEDENYKALYELYKTYLPYKNLYVKEQAGLPGYPTSYEGTAPAHMMDDQLKSAETLLNNPKTLDNNEVVNYTYMFPFYRTKLLDDLVNYPEGRYFSIKNTDNRGYLVYAANAPKGTGSGEEWNYVWSTGKSYEVTSEAGTGSTQTTTVNITFDASNAAHLWCFLNHTKVDGTKEHYLYNVGLKKYARPTKVVGTYGGYTWVLTDEPAPITLKIYDYLNRKMAITAKSVEVASDTVVYASVNTGYTGPVISQYEPGDGSLPFTFDWGTVEFADTTAVAALVRTPITLRPVAKATNPLITGLDDNQSICTYSSTKAFRVPAGVTAYYAKDKDANHIVRLKAVPDGIVPANEGVLLVGAVNKTKAMLDVDYRTEVTAESNIFRNTASGPTAMGANCYVLANSTDGIGFYHATQGTTLSQGKAYLDFSGSSVRAFTLSFGDDDVTTGISNIKADGNAENAPVYDLSGRRIAQPYGRGIYIKNGKKYFVK